MSAVDLSTSELVCPLLCIKYTKDVFSYYHYCISMPNYNIIFQTLKIVSVHGNSRLNMPPLLCKLTEANQVRI